MGACCCVAADCALDHVDIGRGSFDYPLPISGPGFSAGNVQSVDDFWDVDVCPGRCVSEGSSDGAVCHRHDDVVVRQRLT
jgi:hypothetical protein